jgi:TonB family protein
MGRLRAEAWVAFKQVPRRGLEIGGILLGRVENGHDATTFWIDGFEAVESEHRSGPSYVLSEADLARLRDAVESHGERSIGIYRSQTRSEELTLEDSDVAMFERGFEMREALFLMLAPVAGTAAVFTKVDGRLKSVQEFSLASAPLTGASFHHGQTGPRAHRHHQERSREDRRGKQIVSVDRQDTPAVDDQHNVDQHGVDQHLMRPQAMVTLSVQEALAPELVISESGAAEKNVPQPDVSEPPRHEDATPVPPPSSKFALSFRRGLWILAGAILAVVVAGLVGGLLYSSRSPAAVRGTPEYINLTVQRDGSALRLAWDGNSSATRNAAHAILRIEDGGSQIDRDLTPAEIKAGSFGYQPKSSDVTFRLEVFSADPKGAGMVQAVNLIPAAPAGESKVNPAPKSPAASQFPVKAGAAPEHAQQPVNQASEVLPIRQETARQETAPPAAVETEPRASDAAPPAPQEKPQQAAPVREIPAASASTHELSVQIIPEGVSVTRAGPWTEKIAALRGSGKPVNTYAPVPVRQAEPSLNSPDWQHLTKTMFVDVRVNLTETGAMTSAQVLRYDSSSNVGLANAALAAARRWTFQPARVDDIPVPSELILRFRFTP